MTSLVKISLFTSSLVNERLAILVHVNAETLF